MNNKYFYYIVDQCECVEDAREFESAWYESESKYIARDAVRTEWRKKKGHEWMEVGIDEVVLLRKDMTEIGRFSVSFELDLAFSVSQIKKEKE